MRTVLLVIQSETFRLVLEDMLKEHFRVIMAQDAASGAVLLQERPDVLMLDLFLSGTDGFHFLEENRTMLPQTIILFTTLNTEDILQTASDLGVSAMYLKPCSISAALKHLKELL